MPRIYKQCNTSSEEHKTQNVKFNDRNESIGRRGAPDLNIQETFFSISMLYGCIFKDFGYEHISHTCAHVYEIKFGANLCIRTCSVLCIYT